MELNMKLIHPPPLFRHKESKCFRALNCFYKKMTDDLVPSMKTSSGTLKVRLCKENIIKVTVHYLQKLVVV